MKTTLGLLLSSTVVSPAVAGVIGFASLDDFRISLIDLDPADGITPELTYVPDPRAASASTYVSRQGEYLATSAPFQPLRTSFSEAMRSATAENRSNSAYAFMNSSVLLDSPSASVATTVAASASRPSYGWVLSPHTRILIDAHMHTAIAVSELNWRGDFASGIVSMDLTSPSGNGRPITLDAAETRVSLIWDPSDADTQTFKKESSKYAAISWDNVSSETTVLGFSYLVSVTGESRVAGQPAIPEPSSWAFFATGLLPIWLAIRRPTTATL
ncbi:hypothetical protein [Pelomonas cellulosilytica]|uniref:PEP-CTERM protein-sorting domain-containing protein n=1 Tax=Pelomonas cellulosilytica TaxID=2906762 RepID=A0ABS8XJC5_9BURK|nr:hypothetical protein [Pelomonas sp. P8]MCE4552962.1 hypothetical protein [Pelomonas sp. P8]